MIEVGEWVRTDKGNIGKVIGIYPGHHLANYHIEFQTNTKRKRQYLSMKTIKSHSKFLIDLIECGDIVEYDSNNYGADIIEVVVETCSIDEDYEDRAGFICTAYDSEVRINEIKSILTHEEFEMRKYKVKEN